MKYVKIKLGEYDIEKIKEIFENEDNFKPSCQEDSIIIEVMRQCINEDNIIDDEENSCCGNPS